MTWDVLVLGVGGMGAAALAHCATRGMRVIGVEQDDVPSLRGSSVGQTRIIRKAYFEDARYVPLLHRAYELWNDLDPALFVRTGCLNLGPAEQPDIRGVLDAVRLHSLPHERLDAQEVRARFPAFEPAPSDVGVYEEDAGYLHVEACTEAHAKRAIAHGAELRTRAKVARVVVACDDVRAFLESGEEIRAKKLVLSAGPWLPKLGLAHGLPPLSVTRQIQLWFEASSAAAMPAFIHFVADGAFYGLPPTKDGVKVCRHHGGEVTSPETLDRALRAEDERDVRSYIDAHLPIAARGQLLRSQVCMYTSTPDKNFVVGVHPRHPSVIVLGGFSGHGYKMASVMGEIAADLAERGATDHDITLFDPAR